MPEPLKNLYNEALIEAVGCVISEFYPSFNQVAFKGAVFDEFWDKRELKQRMSHIAESLHTFLPHDYESSLLVLKSVAAKLSGFEYMFFPTFVELYGMDHFAASMDALEAMTEFSSSELAVRPFIIRYGEKTMQRMTVWAESDNHHLRRLASEGCRPRLPWAMALPAFKQDPTPVLAVITGLLNDESKFVQRSVANNLNDISKDHPAVLIDLLRNRMGENTHSDWILKHASRTLLKQGNEEVMQLFGFQNPGHIAPIELHVAAQVVIGKELPFSFVLRSDNKHLGKIRIEYAIDFMKANGKQRRKLFWISEANYSEASKPISRTHSFRPISTRRYYPGRHQLAVIVNGEQLASATFILIME